MACRKSAMGGTIQRGNESRPSPQRTPPNRALPPRVLITRDSVAAARRGDRQRFPIKVPFDREMVIAAVLATHSNGCTGVRITRVISEKDRLVTHYQRDHYPGNTLCPAAMTTAFHLVTVPVSKLPVVFVEEADNTPAD